ncbi:MAG: DMT family transporter [Desulfofustis sp.]|jgi:drug/metabolite transporter (DMT)-like permease|nr:DMT family transporter [Desulfofustis sp.]
MRNVLFYLAVVLIWGTSWIGIKMQLGRVDPLVSVVYRFSLAALILLVWCRFKQLPMRFSRRDHGFIFLQGLCLFAVNYLLFYIAELYIASGLAALIFSTLVLLNIINGALFLKSPIDRRVVFGALLGLTGISLVFRSEIGSLTAGVGNAIGIVLSLCATLFASWGSIVAARNQKHGLPVVQTNAIGMAYGAGIMLVAGVAAGRPFAFDFSAPYVGSLFYLALFSSVIAFGCYLTLVGTIGADRAAYATLLFPIVALVISTIWEDYRWTASAASGVVLILAGNLWIIRRGAGRRLKA